MKEESESAIRQAEKVCSLLARSDELEIQGKAMLEQSADLLEAASAMLNRYEAEKARRSGGAVIRLVVKR